MKPLNARQLIRILEQNGFLRTRTSSSHMIYRHPESGPTVSVPFHGKNKPIKIGTFLAIVKQSKLPRSLFEPR